MKRILVLGATGHVGNVVVAYLLQKNYRVVALVRNPQKLQISHKNLQIIMGNVMDEHDLSKALDDIDVVISTLGHGFRTSFPIQEKTLKILIPLMQDKHISRFITVTGAGLKVKGDPQSFIADVSDLLFPIIDPYRMQDAKVQQELLEKSDLDWTVVRTPIHSDRGKQTVSHVAFTQPAPWQTISRKAIAKFMGDCIEENKWVRKAPIIQ